MWEQLAHHRAVNVSCTKCWQVCWWYRKRAWKTGKNTGVQMFLPEMAFSPFGEATVMAEAFPMLSTWPRPTWLLKLRTCQPMTLASCCTAWTWCCDIWNRAERRHENVDIDHQLLPPQTLWGTDWYLRQEEVLKLLFLVRQSDDPSISVHHPDLLNTNIQLQLNRPKYKHQTLQVMWEQSID